MKTPFSVITFFLLFFVTSTSVNAQKEIKLINSGAIFQKCSDLLDSGKYDDAAALYEQISRNDTSYAVALYKDAIARLSAGEDSACAVMCRKCIAQKSEYTPASYKFLCDAYTDLEKYDDAAKLMHDTVIPMYPNLYYLHYSLGLAYYKAKKFDSAIACFERAINLNVFDASSHYYLGKCCLEQGRMIPAMLSLQFYLLLEPLSSRSFATVQLVEQVSEGKYDYNKATVVDPSKYHDDDFQDLDLIIKSKIALNDDYKAKTKISYGVVKQLQLFMEKLTYTANTGNFWMENYVPFFIALQKNNYFEPYAYYIIGSINNDDLQKDISKEKRKIDEFTSWAGKQIRSTHDTKEVTVDGKKKTITYLYYDNHTLEASGEQNSKQKNTGEWTIYNQFTGNTEAKGVFNDNGEREGQWIWYYYNGVMKERTNYKNGKREGLSEGWYRNGAKKYVYNFSDDKLNGEAKEFTASGIPSTSGNYKNDKPDGTASVFYSNGKQRYQVNYTETGLDGEQKEFYLNGQQILTSTYKGGKKNGTFSEYWSNGKLEDKGDYKDDKTVGKWKYYYRDGSLHKDYTYNNEGKIIDTLTTYFRNGKKSEQVTYNKTGDLNGPDILYDDDGIKYADFEYHNGSLTGMQFFDKKGNVTSEKKASGNKLAYENYYANGIKYAEGDLTGGKRNGLWKFYTHTGLLSTEENYKDGLLSGERTEYYLDGKIKDSLNYKNDQANGLYHGYYNNGQPKSTGWYVDGQQEGDWYFYNIRGTMTSHRYFLRNEIYGYADYYDVTGRISAEEYTNPLGYFDKAWVYDSTGKIVFTYASDNGNGTYKPTYSNGQAKFVRNYVAGNSDGPQTSYFPNGKTSLECSYLADNLEGKYTVYFEDGTIKEVNNYDIGSLDGISYNYYHNGKLRNMYSYMAGDLDGPYKEYYEDGHIKRTGYDLDGNASGESKRYFEDSILYCVTWYKDDIITGYSYPGKDGNLAPTVNVEKGTGNVVCYYANGTKSLEAKYDNGELNGKRTTYTPEGKVYADENFAWGYEEGPQKYYFKNGTLKAEENYYMGNKDGVSRYYYDNGKPEHEEHWLLGERHGTFTYYDRTGKQIKTEVYYNDERLK